MKHNIIHFYASNNFDKNELDAIREAKKKAISEKYISSYIEEIGTGSSNKTTVFCIPNPEIPGDMLALKIISYVTIAYPNLKFYEAIKALKNDTCKGNRIIQEIQNCLKTQDCRNVIPLSGFDTLIWQCPAYNRVGIDYILKMPLAKCISNTISKYVLRKKHLLCQNNVPSTELPEDEGLIIKIGLDICLALEDLHSTGIIHRDIKPDNIFLYEKHYCVGDFGIAIENQNTQDLHSGTQSYYAPEQALDIFTDKYDHRVDIYSLGLVLYELADTIPVALRYNDRIYNQYLPDLGKSVSQGLNAIIHKACQFDPGDRYQNASAFKRDLNLLQKDPGYVPDFPTVQSHEGDFQIENHKKGVSNNTAYSSGQKGSPYKRKKIQSRHAVHDLSIPETMWYAGKFWYDKSSEHGSRFEFLNIDRQIMPSSVHSGGSGTDLPVNVYVHSKKQGQVKPLSEIIEDTEHIHNMYLIGEGGIGKTTALYSIMENAYKNMQYHPSDTKKTIIPLFIELSKAPLEYGPVYTSMRSSFIHCYVYMLIRSLSNKQLILEDNAEMLHIMQNSSEEAVCQVNTILKNTPDNIEYLLLLDGLNEVSRKPVYMNGSANISESPVEMITAEIQELLAHQNIRIIITSRSDEYLDEMENSFEKYYLTGIDNNTIYSYLGRNHVPVENIKNNSRLLDTLRVPLFLKLYCQLYSVNEVSTPGEILYTYFSERSTMYTARKRIQEIKKDRTATGMPYTSNIINEKTQWFILDFLLPEIGWYMEKNGLFTIDQQTIKSIIDPILTGTDLTDICGKYGISLFKDYHKGNDGTINVKTYADYLVSLHIDGKSYIQEIIDYCVYSFGILCVNNQHYSFIHQHIRDFFASMKIITNMKLATYIATSSSDNELGRHCLTCLTSELLSEDIVRFIGEILGEYQNVPVYVDGKWESCKTNEIKSSVLNVNSRFLITDALKLFQNYFPEENNIDYGVWNLLKIIYTARKTLAAMNLKNLDLRGCSLNNLELYDADLSGSLIYHENIFPSGHNDVITKAVVSPSGKYVFTGGYDGKLKLWHLKTTKCIKDIKKYDYPIIGISISQDYIAVSTTSFVEILDLNTYEMKKRYNAYYGVFSPNGKYLLLLFHMKKAQLINAADGLFSLIGKLPRADRCTYTDGIPRFGSYMFSPDSRYFIFKPFALSSRCHIELWSTDTCKFIKKIVGYDYSNHVAFSPDEKYILTIDSLCQLKLFAFDKVTGSTSLIHDTEIKHILNYEIPTMTCIQFVCNGKYVLMGDNYGNLFLCDFETILTSPKNIEKHCWILSGHHDSINSISEYIYNDAHYAITSSSDCKVKIWNLQTKKCISLLHKGNISSTLSACYILNGKYIVVSGNSRELLIFDPLTGKYVDRIGTTDNYTWKYTWKVSYHAETKQLAVVLDNGSVALYRYQNNTFVHQKTVKMMDEYIGELKFSPKGDKLLTISYIGNILCIYNILSEKLITLDKVNSIHKSDAFAYLDTDTSGTPPNYDDTVVEVTTAPGKAVQTSRNYTFRGNGTFSYPDGDTVLASFQNADSIGYFDSATGKFKGINHAYYEPYRKNIMHKLYKKSQDFPWSIGMRQVDSIAYNRDGTYLFITRHGGRVEIWSTFTGKCLAILKAFNADAKKLAVSDDGDYIAFSTCGPNIKIYRMCDIHTTDSFDLCYSDNITDWKCKYNIRGEWRFQVRKSANKLYHFIYKTQEGHKQPIAGMEFSPDKKQLLTTAYDRSVKIRDLSDASRDQYNISPHCLYSIEFIPGLKVKGAVIQNLHSSSNLTDKELESLKTYGAIL